MALRGLLTFYHFLRTGTAAIDHVSIRPGRSSPELAPIPAGGLARRIAKGAGEIGLTGEIERKRDIDQRLVAFSQQALGAIKPPRADIAMRRLADSGLERTGEIELVEACVLYQAIEQKSSLQLVFNVVEHPRVPSPIN